MPIPIDQIIARMEWAARNQLAEYAAQAEGLSIVIRRRTCDVAAPVVAAPATDAADVADVAAHDDALRAPLAGLCHLRPEVGGAPFVNVGDRVEAGQTVCIVEAMKMMTSIPAGVPGTVREILIADGETVAAGAPLMRIG